MTTLLTENQDMNGRLESRSPGLLVPGAMQRARELSQHDLRPDRRRRASFELTPHHGRPLPHADGGPGEPGIGQRIAWNADAARRGMNAEDDAAVQPTYRLLLLVAGDSLRSRQATANLRRVCDEHLSGRVDLQIIDICEQPELAREYQVVATPTLLKLAPAPVRRIIGDLSDKGRVMEGLELTDPR